LVLLSMVSEPNTMNLVFPGFSLSLTLFIHFWMFCKQFCKLWNTKWYIDPFREKITNFNHLCMVWYIRKKPVKYYSAEAKVLVQILLGICEFVKYWKTETRFKINKIRTNKILTNCLDLLNEKVIKLVGQRSVIWRIWQNTFWTFSQKQVKFRP
jgi:hypothetical protein